ncbi:MAG: hypothetical protein J2P17_19950, partial [Mycobacterium sp.]|nr:hypothetical protein [Mycobacterium sp.]
MLATWGRTWKLYSDVFATGQGVTVEAWVYLPNPAPQGQTGNSVVWGIRFTQDPRPGSDNTYHILHTGLQADGRCTATIGYNFTQMTSTEVIDPSERGWVYFQASFNFSLSQTTIRWRINNHDFATKTVSAVPGPGYYDTGGPFYVQLCNNRTNTASTWPNGVMTSFEGLQCFAEGLSCPSNYTFTPQAYIDPSVANLIVSP